MKQKKQKFIRTARITGYLVGDIKRWNPGKKAELSERVSHLSANENKEENKGN